MIRSIAVFCGSSTGFSDDYIERTRQLGATLAQRGITVVYGAGNVGLMGVLADAALEEKGKVIGVIPHFLKDKEVCHEGLSELHLVDTMHQRKEIMAELSDAFLVLPGGFGTMDEFYEILTWKQLHLHDKPIGLLNWAGYYDHLLRQFDKMVNDGFLKEVNLNLLRVAHRTDRLLTLLETPSAAKEDKWA